MRLDPQAFHRDIVEKTVDGRVYDDYLFLHTHRGIKALLKDFRDPAAPLQVAPAFLGTHGITDREAEVIRAVIEGQSNKEIAYNMGLSTNTVRNHIRSVFVKTGVSSRVQLFNAIRKQGA